MHFFIPCVYLCIRFFTKNMWTLVFLPLQKPICSSQFNFLELRYEERWLLQILVKNFLLTTANSNAAVVIWSTLQQFFIFVIDIVTVISSHIQKFADDCKVCRSVSTAEDFDILQQDINNLCQWSKEWQMLFNVKKCKVLHIGHTNAYCDYSMNDEFFNLLQKRLTLVLKCQMT